MSSDIGFYKRLAEQRKNTALELYGKIDVLKQQRDDLLEACKAWMKVESEMKDKNPCPDLALRANYRKKAVKLTEAAIAKCNA